MGTAPSQEHAERLRAGLDAACAEAAEKLCQADILLLCTGAGFSADSGLAIYADVARVGAYAERGLKYHDICQPQWLESEPDLFWGFWGQCFNDYRDTAPHPGYQIVDGWADRLFRNSALAEGIRQRLASSPDTKSTAPYDVTDYAGGFFVFTSNVDAHHFDWFRACEIRECHGNTELYQCALEDGPCTAAVWRAPLDFRFRVDKETMLAPRGPSAECDGGEASAVDVAAAVDPAAPRIGQVRGGGRPTLLRHFPGMAPEAAAAGFAGNHPQCPQCGGPARPAILMFGDHQWLDVSAQENRWAAWKLAVCSEVRRSSDRPVRAVVLEVGAGSNVPTVRHTAETSMAKFRDAGADARLIRVNLDLPCADRCSEDLVISIMGRGLESLSKIDAAMAAREEGRS